MGSNSNDTTLHYFSRNTWSLSSEYIVMNIDDVQTNLPSIEVQLELLKEELANYDDYKFNFVTGIHLVTKELCISLLVNPPHLPSLDNTIRWVFIVLADKIAFECVKKNTREVNILLADSYLFPIEKDEEVKIKGKVLVNFS